MPRCGTLPIWWRSADCNLYVENCGSGVWGPSGPLSTFLQWGSRPAGPWMRGLGAPRRLSSYQQSHHPSEPSPVLESPSPPTPSGLVPGVLPLVQPLLHQCPSLRPGLRLLSLPPISLPCHRWRPPQLPCPRPLAANAVPVVAVVRDKRWVDGRARRQCYPARLPLRRPRPPWQCSYRP